MARAIWNIQGGGIVSDECTATEADVLKGKTAIVKDGDEPVEGELEVQSIVNFNVALYSSLALIGTWQNPKVGPYSGVMIRYKTGDYPTDPEDGDLAYEGADNSFIVSRLMAETEYYFRAWSYMTTNYGRFYAGIYLETIGTAHTVQGNQTFTSSGAWIVPDGVRAVDVFLVGGGGRGGNGGGFYDGSTGITTYVYAGGGGGGYTKTYKNILVTPGDEIAIAVGGSGGASRFGSYAAGAGGGGYCNLNVQGGGGSGGSGGGGRNGGSDGSAGSGGYAGNGQGTTTRAFGEASGTLYAGGGGGGGHKYTNPGSGGAGGGGRGNTDGTAQSGTANTGGGGGGGGSYDTTTGTGGAGGAGIVLIRWGY